MHGGISQSAEYASLPSGLELADFSDQQERHASYDSKTTPSARADPTATTPMKTSEPRDLWEGWRFGASLGGAMCYVVLCLNIVATIWASLKSGGTGYIFQGSCKVTEHLNLGVHLAINVLSTLLLGASNYSMQCLCAPTRSEIDATHRHGQWMDIGTQSLRNLSLIRPLRTWLWIALALSSLPLHLFYNSMFYVSTAMNVYDVYVASDDWLQGALYNGSLANEEARSVQMDLISNRSAYEELSNEKCIDAYAHSLLSDRSNVILVFDECYLPRFCTPSLARGPNRDGSELHKDQFDWVCDRDQDYDPVCDPSQAREKARQGNWIVAGYHVTGCLSRKVQESCAVKFNLTIAILVILVNVGKAACITFICFFLKDEPLMTPGDAIASFLKTPDDMTAGCCLLSKDDFDRDWYETEGIQPKVYSPQRFRLYSIAGRKSWIAFFVLLMACICIILILLIYASIQIRSEKDTPGALWTLGFGTLNSHNLIRGMALPSSGTPAVLSNILVANSPQVILSGIYLMLNNLITRIQLNSEWNSFSVKRKALRISHLPRGDQRSTYFLQIPYRVALPLMVVSIALHWLVSQSIFLADVDMLRGNGSRVLQRVITCGYSPLAMLFTAILGGLVGLTMLGIGYRENNFKMPLVRNCSVGISAACHPPETGADAEKPLMWGAVSEALLSGNNEQTGDEIGHCSFSSSEVDSPVEGRQYA